ncbi:D12 class N6 adenine-specific DNA methyltransferase protein [Rhizobium sp. TAL182]|uniref:DNA adenine methylase n=1 Tax=Rhizobium sp. TAL182 TaxID=2020313 RepID=UPI000A2117C8|nr:DNA adenine methylase [Rhizobium sp. TAL182]ARO22927.1 D12 class N6 adenine-specific DNA methyltransferase protein [Rhizobium sp. TAL182]
MQPNRPVLRWHGSKWRIAEWVIAHFPPHKVYVEPFGGSGAVILQKPRAITEVYNDLDRDLVNMFKVLRDRPADLALALALTPYARDEYRSLCGEPADDLDRARSFIARSFMGMSSKGAVQKSGFDARTNPDGYTGRLRSLASLPDEVLAVAGRFTHVLIENVPAVDCLKRYSRTHALIYMDPPYVASTRSAGKLYRHEMSDDDHRELLERARTSEAMILISGYRSELYDAILGDWRRVQTVSYADGGRERLEVLWINPAAADALQGVTEAHSAGHGTPLFSIAGGAA